jgi:AcrR family transcriptional regulator
MAKPTETKAVDGVAKPSVRQRERTILTRARLLRAAETIFARDGFEAAKLEEIASAAGYTRGALYANFASKEELFVALLEDHVEKRMAGFASAAETGQTMPNLFEAMRENYVRAVKDRTWNILFLEYKLFVLRHPEFREKLLPVHKRIFARTAVTLDAIYAIAGIKLPVSTLAAALAMGALANTLGVDLALGRMISEGEVDVILRLFFDALIFGSKGQGE